MSNDLNQDIAKELVSQTAGKTYDDLAHPTAQATGEIISFIPRTIRVWFGKWEKWILNGEYAIRETEKLLEEKLKHIPEDKIVEPEPYVAVPAIQQLSYSLDSEELRELYASLLASSMNVDKKDAVHPAFVDIIRQLTPSEAKLLSYIYKCPYNSVLLRESKLYTINNIKEGSYDVGLEVNDVLINSIDGHTLSICLDNLVRLGLLTVQELVSSDPNTLKIIITETLHAYALTDFSQKFCEICVSN